MTNLNACFSFKFWMEKEITRKGVESVLLSELYNLSLG